MASIQHLPPEVLLEIFGYLSLEELQDSIQHVCTTWRELTKHPSLWQDFVYSTHSTDDIQVVKFINKSPALRHIKLQAYEFKSPDGLIQLVTAIINNCTDIRTLCVCFDWHLLTESLIEKLFQAAPNLECFEFRIDVKNAFEIAYRISKITKLKKLYVRSVYYHTGPDGPEGLLKPVVDGCISLQHLCFNHAVVTENDLLYILKNMRDKLLNVQFSYTQPITQNVVNMLGSFTKLQQLAWLHNEECGQINYVPIAKIRTLKSLSFSSHSRKASDIDSIFETLFDNPFTQLQNLCIYSNLCQCEREVLKDVCLCYPNLKELRLVVCQENVIDSFEEVGRLKNLEYMQYLANKTITDDDIECIAQCHKLKHLDLSYCSLLADRTIIHLAKCSLLESLTLSYTSLTKHGLRLIPKYLQNLKRLEIDNIKAEKKDSALLAEKMPGMKVIHYC